ncbi:MAG: hypothetical protein Q8N16_01955 [bacterium]|nr:hypothetical protein [bacterium]
MEKLKQPTPKTIGTPTYINKNCWLATTLGYPPAKRCWFCELRFRQCPFAQYLGISLLLALISFVLAFLIDGKITRAHVFIVFILVLAYGYFTTRTTEKIIEANFAEKLARIALEEAKASLEGKIKERTKELENLTKNLGQKVDIRTTELEEKLEELEKINRLAVGRELRMIELKEKIRKLEEELEKAKTNAKSKI